jgi:hypothetical protein
LLFAEQWFELSGDAGDGVSLGEHLHALWRQTGVKPAQLEIQEFPELFRPLWEGFVELCHARSSHGFGPNPLSFSEIKAWDDLTGAGLSPFDTKIIKQLDRVFLSHQAKIQSKTT